MFVDGSHSETGGTTNVLRSEKLKKMTEKLMQQLKGCVRRKLYVPKTIANKQF
jgi:hypothetical protein